MKTSEFLEIYQPIAFKIFYNSFKHNHFNHAYILNGPKSSSVDKIAIFLAQSLICKNSVLACEKCVSCKRIEENKYPSLVILDAKNGIKIDELKTKIESFYTSPIEKDAKNIYIIYNIDYLKLDCINMILKFLEEPPINTYAIFTAENLSLVLPTIVSRCETIRLKPLSTSDLFALCKNENINQEDLIFISKLNNDCTKIKDVLSNKNYLLSKEFLSYFRDNISNKDKLMFEIEKNIIPKINLEAMYFIYDSLIILLKEALKSKYHQETDLIDFNAFLLKIRDNIKDLEAKIEFLMEQENLLNKNINLSLELIYTLNLLLEVNK